tara:strand:- start:114 stop:995 length:882 start_codon:yes stop_codon:yes gene_type:complete
MNNLGINRISPSALDLYERCPKAFYYRVFLGLMLPEEDRRHLEFGTAIHSALENLYVQYDDNFKGAWEVADFKQVENRFLGIWKPHIISESEFERFKLTKKGRESNFVNALGLYNYMKKDGLDMLKSYWNHKEWLLAEHLVNVKEGEKYMKIEIVNPNNKEEKLSIPMALRIDGISKEGNIIEFKTSGAKYSENEAKQKIQGQCYSFAQYQETGKKRVPEVSYVVLLKDRRTDERIQVVHLKYDEFDMVVFYHRVDAILKRIRNREFSKQKIGHLPYCECLKFDELLNVDKLK